MTDILPLLDIPDETQIMQDSRVALSEAFYPAIFWRQNVGSAWMGKAAMLTKATWVPAGCVVVRHPQLVKFGVKGQNDVMGIVHGRFVGIEVKTETGEQRKHQVTWQDSVRRAGGVSYVARSPDQAVRILRETVAAGGWDR